MNSPYIPLSGLARRLVRDGILTEDIAQQAVSAAAKEKTSLPQVLVATGKASALSIANAASDEFGTPIIDITMLSATTLDKNLVDHKLIRKHQALPIFKRGNRLFLGIADPTNLHALDEIKFNTGLNTEGI